MCIRDRLYLDALPSIDYPSFMPQIDSLDRGGSQQRDSLSHQAIEDYVKTIYALAQEESPVSTCLLYTSDAADERSSVDLGGRRIIKKKKHKCNVESDTLDMKKEAIYITQVYDRAHEMTYAVSRDNQAQKVNVETQAKKKRQT